MEKEIENGVQYCFKPAKSQRTSLISGERLLKLLNFYQFRKKKDEKECGMRKKVDWKERISFIFLLLLCAATAILEVIDIEYCTDEIYNRLIGNTVPLIVGTVAVTLLILRGGGKIFGKPSKLWAMIPCLIIAVDNFPFLSYFAGKMELIHTQPLHFILFGLNCLFVGLFEELIFRGIFFAALAGLFSKDRKGFLKTYILSSVIFGGMHIFNLFAGADPLATLLQVGYSVLTGGLFAFALIKTKNILFPAITHAVYNFGGLLFTAEQGLGAGSVVFYLPTVIMMAIVSVIVGGFVLYKVLTYTEEERIQLYKRLGFGVQPLENKRK